jgi:Flp pilus assembly protein TadG
VQKRRGQGLVEFALILPILVLVLVGVFDAGRMVYAYNAVSNAAREAGRTAIVNQDQQVVRDRAAQQATGLALPAGSPGSCPAVGGTTSAEAGTCVVLVGPNAVGTCPTPPLVGCVSVVTVWWTYHAIVPVIGTLLGPKKVVSISKQPIESVCPPPPSGGSCPVR